MFSPGPGFMPPTDDTLNVAGSFAPERLRMAEPHSKAETIHFDDVKVYDRLMEMTGGRGPDRCIDAVGAEAHGRSRPVVFAE